MNRCYYNFKSSMFHPNLQASEDIKKELAKRGLVDEYQSNETDALAGLKYNESPLNQEWATCVAHEYSNVISLITSGGSLHDITRFWFLDSGCSRHVVNSKKHMFSYVPLKRKIPIQGISGKVNVIGIGRLCIKQNINGEAVFSVLKEVGYAPRLCTNLISDPKAQEAGLTVIARGHEKIRTALNKNRIVMIADTTRFWNS